MLLLFNLASVCSEESSLGIDHAEEMELLLDNYYLQVQYYLINLLVQTYLCNCVKYLSLL